MRINVDLRESFEYGGISNFKRNLSKELLQFGDLFLTGCFNWSRASTLDKFGWFDGKIKRSIVPDQIIYRFAEKFNIDIPISYETLMQSSSDVNLFLTYRIPKVKYNSLVLSTIHDIILFKVDSESRYVKEKYESILRHTLSKSHGILTVSESAKSDLIDYFNLNPDNIHIVHNGIELQQFEEELSKDRLTALTQKYGLPETFVLYFGGYRVHKNIERLLQAYALLPFDIRKELKLVITNKNPQLLKLATQLKIDSDTIFTGFIDEKDKCAMYKAAYIVYYASLYEGFGVPVIESQICRTPVITSNTSSLPESSGGFAELINPYSVDEINQALVYLYKDNARRDYLISHGVENAMQYTWQRGAQELYNILINNISKNGGK